MQHRLRESTAHKEMSHGLRLLVAKRAARIAGETTAFQTVRRPATVGARKPNPNPTLQRCPTTPDLSPTRGSRAFLEEVKERRFGGIDTRGRPTPAEHIVPVRSNLHRGKGVR
ncbi:hypothetical protein BRADI_4g43713v3 [Brachypodium distachyon]|uniref:Uncharacterized protein n=1 Tax=Brachypodium distachyon TaxID=15368 RepID=A0A0Q3HVY4_BRADI|nr:hypothetical protein BRADI_4g43713v3 [Brachypodium distachyon]